MLPRALRHMLAQPSCAPKTRAAVNKVVRVWDERRVSGAMRCGAVPCRAVPCGAGGACIAALCVRMGDGGP